MPLIPLLIKIRKKINLFPFICSFGSILVGCFGYLLCQFIWWSNSGEFSQFALLFFQYIHGFDMETFNHIKILHEKYDFLIIFTVSLAPISFKVFTLIRAFSISLSMLVIASFISRSSRFFYWHL